MLPQKRQSRNPAPPAKADSVRVHKYLADRGVASRRAAETLVREGRVSINGDVATIGQPVDPVNDRVVVDGRPVRVAPRPPVTLIIHKPPGFLCSNDDPHHARTVFDILPTRFKDDRLFCAGRLDLDSEGLLVLTSDGDLAAKLTHPSHAIIKRYRLTLHRPFVATDKARVIEGVWDEGEKLSADHVYVETRGHAPGQTVEVHLGHGRKRELRRLFKLLGYHVERLIRFQIGSLTLRGMGPGEYRELKPHEIRRLLHTGAQVKD